MDGNGRWAKQKGLSRLEGHRAGGRAAQDLVRYVGELKVPFLTLFAFSSENWARPKDEVFGLMAILYEYLTKESQSLVENGVRFNTIGDLTKLPLHIQKALSALVSKTKEGDRLCLTLALSYGARDEICRATRQMLQACVRGEIQPDDIKPEVFSRFLDTRDLPDPDLFVRTSGEMRLSNFLLWQLSYAELYMSQKLWPDFSRADLDDALRAYAERERRFGLISEQLLDGQK